MTAPHYQPVICPVAIGRAAHLEVLVRAIARTQCGQGQIALVTGEAGIGKSRLVAEAISRAGQQGLCLLQGQCFESDRALPYAPLLDLLRNALASQGPNPILPHLASQAGELIKILPELARWLPEAVPTPATDPEGDKRRIFQALAQVLTDLAGLQPLFLVIEDLHWSDETSLDFLLYLCRRLPNHPLMVLLTYRSDEAHPELQHALAALDRERRAIELRLEPLAVAEVEAMLRAIFGPRRPVRAEFIAALYELTEGNPFFVEEVLKAVVVADEREGRLIIPDHTALQAVRVPRTVQQVVQRRSRQLRPFTHRVLALAAVIGRRFDFTLLQEILRVGDEQLLRSIKELIAAQLVGEASEEQFAFRHALTRQAVYEDLLARERRALHQAIGEALERRQEQLGAARMTELSWHYYEAGVWVKAREYAERAGARAQALYASRAAVDLYTRAADATLRLGLTPTPAIYRARGLAYETLGYFDAARADHETALELAREGVDRRAEWRALLDLGQLWAARDYHRAGVLLQQALDLARELADPGALAISLNRLGNWHMNVEQLPQTLALHEEALAIFRQLDDRRGVADTLDLLSSALLTGGNLLLGTAYSQQAVALLRELGDRHGLASILAVRVFCGDTYLTNTLSPTMQIVEALGEGELALQTARETRWRSDEAFALMAIGQCLGAQGRYARAVGYVQEGLAIAEEIGHRQWLTGAHCLLGMLHTDLLALESAQHYLERGLALAHEIGSLIWVRYVTGYLALVYVAQRDFARAEAVLGAALDATTPMWTLGQRLCWCAHAELALARGTPDRALHIVDQLLSSASLDADAPPIPRLCKLRGDALIALHRLTEAEAILEAARAAALSRGLLPVLWRIHVSFGRLYRAQSRHREAAAAFAQARGIIDALAADVTDVGLSGAFLQRATAALPRPRLPAQRSATRQASGGLTARELEVAVLIARGLTNREIAVALSIAEETAAVHVKHILGSLGFASRAQIAAWVVQKGFLTSTPDLPSGRVP